MKVKDFWSELANLPDEGWKTIFGTDGEILLDPSGMGIVRLNPVMAVACAKNKGRLPAGLEEACAFLDLSLTEGKRVVDAATNPRSPHQRTRGKILRALRPKLPPA